jgi:hypothetical protein
MGQAAKLFDFTGVEDPRGPINQFQNGEFPTMQVNANQPVANMLFGASATPGLSVLGEIAKAMEVNPGIGQFDGVPLRLRNAVKSAGGDGVRMVQDAETGQWMVVDRQTGQPVSTLGGKKPGSAFTLSPGAVRYDPAGKVIAQSPFEPGADAAGSAIMALLGGGQPVSVKTNGGAGVSTAGQPAAQDLGELAPAEVAVAQQMKSAGRSRPEIEAAIWKMRGR